MTSTSCRDNRGLSLLAPGAPRVMIGTDMSGITEIYVSSLRLGLSPDLRVLRLQPFLYQRLIALHRLVQRLLRGDSKLRQQAAHRVPRQTDAILFLDQLRHHLPGPQRELKFELQRILLSHGVVAISAYRRSISVDAPPTASLSAHSTHRDGRVPAI